MRSFQLIKIPSFQGNYLKKHVLDSYNSESEDITLLKDERTTKDEHHTKTTYKQMLAHSKWTQLEDREEEEEPIYELTNEEIKIVEVEEQVFKEHCGQYEKAPSFLTFTDDDITMGLFHVIPTAPSSDGETDQEDGLKEDI